jgi:hypothetical protein
MLQGEVRWQLFSRIRWQLVENLAMWISHDGRRMLPTYKVND